MIAVKVIVWLIGAVAAEFAYFVVVVVAMHVAVVMPVVAVVLAVVSNAVVSLLMIRDLDLVLID